MTFRQNRYKNFDVDFKRGDKVRLVNKDGYTNLTTSGFEIGDICTISHINRDSADVTPIEIHSYNCKCGYCSKENIELI